MLDQVLQIYNDVSHVVIKFILEINFHESWQEISGLLAIILLLFIIRSIRKRRVIQKSEPVRQAQEAVSDAGETETPEPDVEGEAIVEDIRDVYPDITEETDEEPVFESGDFEFAPEDIEEIEEKEEVIAKPVIEKPVETMSFLDRLKSGLSKTRQSLSKRFDSILSGNRKIDDDVLEEIEEVLITSDIGVPTTMELMQRIEKQADKISNAAEFKAQLKQEMLSLVDIAPPPGISEKPYIIMVVGVNGVGKTTTIGKLAAKYSAQGKKVLLSASDTFRAAAVEQLEVWANRSNADIVKHRDKSDPAAVAFDSVEAAVARDVDVVIVDTAGRLHTKVNLMEELKKIKRSIGKKIPSAPHDTFLVLDATTGQNAVSQAKLFNENIDISGIVLTKLDGTAKGGIVLSICNTLNVPIRYIGIGEGVDDLQEFDSKLFVDALL